MANSQQQSRINDALHYIHADINRDLTAAVLARVSRYSEQHFHRLFHSLTGESVNIYVRRTRLETAANQLMFSPEKPILEIAEKCGFRSLSSFTHAFKKQFCVSPGNWRTDKAKHNPPPYLANEEIADAYKELANKSLPPVQYEQRKERHIAYVRHIGYDRSIKQTWNLLYAWAVSQGVQDNPQFGLHHSNPTQTPLEDCHYVACIEIDSPIKKRGIIHSMVLPGGLYARFDFQGKYGELLPSMSKVEEQWLPNSSLVAKTTPAFVEYYKNHFLCPDEQYDLSYFVPLSFY